MRNALLVASLLAVVAGVIITRPFVLARIMLPAAARAIGGDVTADSVHLAGLDLLVIEGLRIRAPGWEGAAGELIVADTVEVRLSLGSLILGDLNVSEVSIGRLDVRIAERADAPGTFSPLALTPEPSDDTRAPRERPTRIHVRNLAIESGMASGKDFTSLGALRFEGELTPIADRPAGFALSLKGLADAGATPAVGEIRGQFDGDARAIEVELKSVVLSPEGLEIAPLAVRTWTKQLGLAGRIPLIRVAYEPGKPPQAEMGVEGLAMDLPIELLGGGELRDSWSGLVGGKKVPAIATPRMTLREGKLRFDGDTVALDGLKGELGARHDEPRVIPVPFECDFTLEVPRDALPVFDWDERETWLRGAAERAPFEMSVRIPKFSSPALEPGLPDVLQLPAAAVKVLADFNVSAWTIDVDTRVVREAPRADGSASPIKTTGSLLLSRGIGAYAEFPYRLEEVHGRIRFENDDVFIDSIVGRGNDGAEVTIAGKLIGIATGAEIDLSVVCADAPVDERLFDAFEEGPGDAIRVLFDETAATRLGSAGMLPDASLLIDQRRSLAQLGTGSDTADDRARLTRSIDAGPFALGGRCGFTLRVYSPAGFGQPVLVTGDVELRDAGLVFERFPYPLRIKSGSFTVLDEAIVIAEGGMQAITPAGGVLRVSGSVQLPRDGRGGRNLQPLIELNDTGDAINPALIAAIPHADDVPVDRPNWPGTDLAPAAELLRALGLSGSLDLAGFVTTNPDGTGSFTIRLDFERGRAAPDAAGRAWLAAQGLPWPEGFVLENCQAKLEIEPDRIRFEECSGRRGEGSILARGFADLNGPSRRVELILDDLPLDGAFAGYLADDPAEARRRFESLQPRGILDGSVTRTVEAGEAVTRGSLVPVRVEVTMDGARVLAERIAGSLEVDGADVRADSLEMRLSTAGADDGLLRLSGPLSEATLNARLAGGRIESPILRHFLNERSPGLVALFRERQASGTYDATYSAAGGETLEVVPKSFSIAAGAPDDPSLRVSLACSATSSINADATAVELAIHGTLTEGAEGRATLKGRVNLAETTVLTASYALDVAQLTPALRAILPPPLDLSARALSLTSTGRFTLDLPAIEARWPAGGAAEYPALYTLDGKATFAGAAFDAGVGVTELEATLPIALRYEPAAPTPVVLHSTLAAVRAKVVGRPIGESEIEIRSADGRSGLLIEGAGDVAGGRFDVASDVDFDRDFYEVRARIAGARFDDLRSSQPSSAPPNARPGRLTGILEINGPLGGTPADVAARRGSLAVSLRDATIASTPFAMRVLQLSQFMLPINSSLHDSDARLIIQGNTASVDQLRLASGTLELTGSGSIDIPTLGVALRLYPRGTLPILSDLIGSLSQALFALDVEGTIEDPKVSIAPIPGVTSAPSVRTPRPKPSASGAPAATTVQPTQHEEPTPPTSD